MMIYLLTCDRGDYHKTPTPMRAYSSDAKCEHMLAMLKRYYAKRPRTPEADVSDKEHDEWWSKYQAWMKRHPVDPECGGYLEFHDWGKMPMVLR